MKKKERLKPISLYGYDLEEAIRAILSVNPKKLKLREEKTQEHPEPRSNDTTSKKGG
ncbi:MAG: hypothetical protein WBG50_01120 [Desulfomonilaceae bacterium]